MEGGIALAEAQGVEGIVFREIALDELRFDPDNPRLPETLDRSSLSDVLEFMLDDAGLLDLMGSIAKQGFFPGEPLLVAPVEDALVVVEGNRRFAACLLLRSPDLAPTRKKPVAEVSATADLLSLDSVPCLLFKDRDAILAHLGYRHVTGIKEWEPLAKARFLFQRFNAETGTKEDRFRSLAKSIGSRSDYVGRLLTAFTLYEQMESSSFFDLPGVTANSIDFSLISSLLAYTAVVEYLGLASSQDMNAETLDRSKLAVLTRVVFQRTEGKTVLGESRNIRKLANVLSDDRASTALAEGSSLSAAARYTDAGTDAFRSFIAGGRESLALARKELSDTSITASDLQAVEEAVEVAGALLQEARVRVSS